MAINEDATLAQAQAADARIAAGQGAPLTGVPMAHKDIFVTQDFPTTAGSKMLEGYRSPFDATVVARKLADAGAGARWASSTCDEFAMGGGQRKLRLRPRRSPPVRNPWDTEARARRFLRRLGRCRGGASGALRPPVPTPAAPSASRPSFRGITGIKPTYGRAQPLRHDRLRLAAWTKLAPWPAAPRIAPCC